MSNALTSPVTDASFEAEVLQSQTPVLLDFWAEWCGPCRQIAPVLEELAAANQGKLLVKKINVDENREVPAKYGIRGIPTLMLFKNGQVAATHVGAQGKTQIQAFIDGALNA